ncbi:hypothetical protein OOT00_12735 [Desulfobotulus sp. H1]|uniref:Uncharacterized protein n=1 Tax=Desulfobotulus pelophilus TaxID=2823377 RepID=A0ABT3NBK2_9BACT|nr:hypothetical protein [Desulfobotulus pelophilus]MCW7754850.1 hypothetical protein [Desulfobotulus pelophilus]
MQIKSAYYHILNQVTQKAGWEEWILFMLKGVEQVARWTCLKIAVVRSLMEQTRLHVNEKLPKIYSHEWL